MKILPLSTRHLVALTVAVFASLSMPALVDASTPVPVPTSSCVPGEPCAHIYATKTNIAVGDQTDLNLSIVNSMGKPDMKTQLLLILPSGMTLSGSGFVDGCTGQCSANYSVGSGKQQSIAMKLHANEAGEFRVSGKVEWYFDQTQMQVVGGTNIDVTLTVSARDASVTGKETIGETTNNGSNPGQTGRYFDDPVASLWSSARKLPLSVGGGVAFLGFLFWVVGEVKQKRA